MPAAVTIDDVIAFAGTDIPEVAYDGALPTLPTQMALWNTGVFSTPQAVTGGIFPPERDRGREFGESQRPVTDWFAVSLHAHALAVVSVDPVSVAECVNAVVRLAYAVKFQVLAGNASVTAAQRTAVIALYNTVWA